MVGGRSIRAKAFLRGEVNLVEMKILVVVGS